MIKTKKIRKEVDENVNYTIKDLNMKDIIPNTFDSFIVTIFEGHHTIVLPSHITGVQFKMWSRGRGGIFSKDVLDYSLNKQPAKYLLFKDDKTTLIIRLIEEKELTTFEALNLVDGQIKDSKYMILRTLKDGDKLTDARGYTNENEMIYEENVSIMRAVKTMHNDEVDYHANSISLFTE